MQRLIPIVGVAGHLAACASPSTRIATGLERYGPTAAALGGWLAHRRAA